MAEPLDLEALSRVSLGLGKQWTADIDNPGEPDEQWTGAWETYGHRGTEGSWRPGDCDAETECAVARGVAEAVTALPRLLGRVRDDAATIATLTAERDAAVRERDEARRSGLTLTAEERSGLLMARRLIGVDAPRPVDANLAIDTIDRLLAGARTVTEPTAEEVEETARALHAMEEKRRHLWRTWDYMDPIAHESYRSIARAAIAAGLDPRRLKEGT